MNRGNAFPFRFNYRNSPAIHDNPFLSQKRNRLFSSILCRIIVERCSISDTSCSVSDMSIGPGFILARHSPAETKTLLIP